MLISRITNHGKTCGLLLAAFALASCSALVDTRTRQCSSPADCADTLGATCGPNGLCVVSDASAATPSETCARHADCKATAQGAPRFCRSDRRCVDLFTKECTSVFPAGSEVNDSTLLVGFMGVIVDKQASYGLAQKQGVDKALQELQTEVFDLPGAPGMPSNRRLAALVCDHGTDGTAAATHLAANLKVPAIVGASFSGVTLKAFEIAAQYGTLILSPAATSPQISVRIDPDDLLWRTVPSDLLQTEALKELVPLVTQALTSKGALAAGQRPVIAIPWKGDPAGSGLRDGVLTGKNAISEAYVPYLDPPEQNNWDEVANRILRLQPHIILHLGTGEFSEIISRVERNWPPQNPNRPWYIVPEGDLEMFKEPTTAPLLQEFRLHERLVGTSPGSRRRDQWRIFRAKFPQEPGNLAEFAYDAIYLLAYGIGGSRKPVPTGVEIARGLRRTSCAGGLPINAGPMNFSGGWREISKSDTSCIDYVGVSGDLTFNDVGEAESDIAVWCLQPGSPGYASVLIDTYWPVSERKLTPYKGTGGPTPTLVDFTKPDWCTKVVP